MKNEQRLIRAERLLERLSEAMYAALNEEHDNERGIRLRALKDAAEDACSYCAGHCPQYDRKVEGPNTAGNYTHKMREPSYDVALNGPRRDVVLCQSSSIHARIRFEATGLQALTVEYVD